MTFWNNSVWKGPQGCLVQPAAQSGMYTKVRLGLRSFFTSKDTGLSVSVSLCHCLTVLTRKDLFSGSGHTCTIAVCVCCPALCPCAEPEHRPPCRSRRSAGSSPKPFLLQSGPPHLPQPLFTQLCPSEHLGSPPLNPLWFISACRVLGVPKTARGVSSGSEKCQGAVVSLDQGG